MADDQIGSGWQPRPDPALDDPQPKGMRAHQHPRNRLSAWVFLQHQVWVDYWGNEHEIESMPADYVGNVIDFCRCRAATIRFLVALSTASEALELCKAGSLAPARRLFNISLAAEGDPNEWLETTPLFRALRRRLAADSDRGDTAGGTNAEEGGGA